MEYYKMYFWGGVTKFFYQVLVLVDRTAQISESLSHDSTKVFFPKNTFLYEARINKGHLQYTVRNKLESQNITCGQK